MINRYARLYIWSFGVFLWTFGAIDRIVATFMQGTFSFSNLMQLTMIFGLLTSWLLLKPI